MLTALLHLRYMAAKPATIPCWSLHVLPHRLAPISTISLHAWSQPPSSHRLHHCGPPFWCHIRASTPYAAIFGFRRAQVSSLPTNTGNGMRRNVRNRALPTMCKDISVPDHKSILDAPTPVLRNRDGEVPSTTYANCKTPKCSKENINVDGLYHPEKVGRSAQVLPSFKDAFLLVLQGALQLGYLFFGLARFIGLPIIVVVLLWNYGPHLILSRKYNHESFRELSEGYADEQEQESESRGRVWSKIFSIFGILAYYWNSDPDCYAGSVLGTIIPIFRDVSLYVLVISVFVYMIF